MVKGEKEMTKTRRNILLSAFAVVVLAMAVLMLSFAFAPSGAKAEQPTYQNSQADKTRVVATTTTDSNQVSLELINDTQESSTRAFYSTPININSNHLYMEVEIKQMNLDGGIRLNLLSSYDDYPLEGYGDGFCLEIWDETAWGYPEFSNLRADSYVYNKTSSTWVRKGVNRFYGNCLQTDPKYYDPDNQVYPKFYIHAWEWEGTVTVHFGADRDGVLNENNAWGAQFALTETASFNPANCQLMISNRIDSSRAHSYAVNNKIDLSVWNYSDSEIKSINVSDAITNIDTANTQSVSLADYFSYTKFFGQSNDVTLSYNSNNSELATVVGSNLNFATKKEGTVDVTASYGSLSKTVTFDVSYSGNYDISYDLGEGATATNPDTYNKLSEDITLINPTKEGYTFAGWTGTGLEEPTMVVTISQGSTGDRSYTATWNPNPKSLTATYSENIIKGNKINPQAISITLTYTDDSTDSVSAGAVTYWYGGQEIQDAINYVFDVVGPLAITVKYNGLEATMNVNVVYEEYSITYELNDGTVDGTNPVSYTEGDEDITLINPTKEGYTFAGWIGTGLEEPTMEVIIAQGSTGNRSYTATWTENNDGGNDGDQGGDVTPPPAGDDNDGGENDPETAPDTTPEDSPSDDDMGCGSSISGIAGISAIATLVGGAILAVKRKKED